MNRVPVRRLIAVITTFLLLAGGSPARADSAVVQAENTLLDQVVARLGEFSPAFEGRGVLAVTVIRFDRPEWASFRGSEQFKAASVVKAVWLAAALDGAGLEATAPLAESTIYMSSNITAGRVIDIAGGIDMVNGFAHTLGLEQTTAYEWEFGGRERRSADYPGPLRGNNLTTTDDLAGFWAAVEYGYALGPAETEAFLDWTLGPKASGEGTRLIARLPEAVGAMTTFKMGWLPIGREYVLDDGETGWGGEPSGTAVTFDRGAITAGAGVVHTPGGGSYAIAISAYDGDSWARMTGWVEYVSCVVYSVVAADPVDCVRSSDPLALQDRRAVPSGGLGGVETAPGVITVTGWAADPDAWFQPTRVAITLDGVVVGLTWATPTGPYDLFAPRFSRQVPYEGGAHEVCAIARNDGNGEDAALGCTAVEL